jgi:hypothetical protein
MNVDFDHWHIVKTEEEMIEKAHQILSCSDLEYKSVMPYAINETAKSVMDLFLR